MPSSVWESMKTVFVSFFRFLGNWIPNRLAARQVPQNPYPFGTREWREFAAAQATDHEMMVLRISDLEAQVQQTSELAQSLEVLATHQETLIRDLRLQNRTLRDGPPPEVFQRILDDIHKPLKKPEQPRGPELESSGSISGPDAPVSERARTSGGGPEPSQGVATGQKTVTRSRPLTLAEELEGQFDDSDEEP